MNKTALLICSIFLLHACQNDYIPREKISISVKNFKIDSSSIRAIELLNDSTVVYAGSIGDIGIMSSAGILKASQRVVYDSIIPHFRSVAATKKAIFALSIANPALLYKLKDNETSIVYLEENENVFYDSMQFFDDLNGLAIGDPTQNCLSVILTDDGGNSWKKLNCEKLPVIMEGEAAFAASNTNIAIVGTNAWIVTGGLNARVFHTSDMGYTWNVYDACEYQ